MNRRYAIKNMAVVPFLGLAGNRLQDTSTPLSIGKGKLKVSLNAYSFNAPLINKSMDIFDLLRWSADTGFDAVDLTGYYFEGYPGIPEPGYLYRIKRLAHTLGIEISGTGVRNDFTIPDKTLRGKEKERVLNWLEVAADLGAPVLRVFAGQEKREGYSREQINEWMIEDLYHCVKAGENIGVIIGLQNHNDFIQNSDQVIEIMKTIPSPWFGLILDTGSYRKEDPYSAIEKNISYAVNWQVKENIFHNGVEVETDLARVISIIRKSDYQGYLPIETLGAGDPKQKVDRLYKKIMLELKNA